MVFNNYSIYFFCFKKTSDTEASTKTELVVKIEVFPQILSIIFGCKYLSIMFNFYLVGIKQRFHIAYIYIVSKSLLLKIKHGDRKQIVLQKLRICLLLQYRISPRLTIQSKKQSFHVYIIFFSLFTLYLPLISV